MIPRDIRRGDRTVPDDLTVRRRNISFGACLFGGAIRMAAGVPVRWIKGPAAVAPMFLKNPTRMRAMGLVLVLALMVRNYTQATVRKSLAQKQVTILHPFTNKPDAKPTTEMIIEHFKGLASVLLTSSDGQTARLPPKPNDTALKVMSILGFDRTIYSSPLTARGPPKAPGLSETPGM